MCVRLAEDEVREGLAWESAPLQMLYAAEPWRTFRWYTGRLSTKRNRDIASRPGGVYGELRPLR
ncbi:hypothetical protein [Streptomyces nogalater]|uniref:Uncharacterized protein n=1 Tax=Streptomyces nogalater TaxID=38314 RepID=A0ABW0WA32_STRNO